MPLYRITARRETLYEFDIETDSEGLVCNSWQLLHISAPD